MCGIAFACFSNSCDAAADGGNKLVQTISQNIASEEWLSALRSRGPDFLGTQSVVIDGVCRLYFTASLLQLRGLLPGKSPGVSAQGHTLCFNGEVFGGLEIPPGKNDATCLLAALSAAEPSSVPVAISRLRGPWALLFWDPSRQLLWFGRDVLGRRSLLLHLPDEEDPRLLFSSVSELPRNPLSPVPGHDGAAEGSSKVGATAAARHPQSAATAGGGGSGSSRADAGADGDEAEPSGCDGYWTELPPGLYSIRFAPASELHRVLESSLAATRRTVETGAATVSLAPGTETGTGTAGECGTEAVVFRHLTVGSCALSVERHSWRDPLPLQLEAYSRMESVSGLAHDACASLEAGTPARVSAGVSSGVPVVAVTASVPGDAGGDGGENGDRWASEASAASHLAAAKGGLDRDGAEDREGASGLNYGGAGAATFRDEPVTVEAVAGAVAGAGAGAATSSGRTASSMVEASSAADNGSEVIGVTTAPPALLGHPVRFSVSTVEAHEELAHALLNVLLAAMRVRCACIETRSPHPSAAYAAALKAFAATAVAATPISSAVSAAVNSVVPEPSWRRDDPMDFSHTHSLASERPQQDAPTIVASACSGVGSSSSSSIVDTGPKAPAGFDTASGVGTDKTYFSAAVEGLSEAVGQHAVGMNLCRNAPIMILFSGGVDSVLLATLAHRVLPLEVPIDLCNVCFAGPDHPSPDREAARDALEELTVACPGRCWRLVEVNAKLEDVDRHRSRLLALLRPAHTVMDLNIGAALWLATSGQGSLRLPTSASARLPTPPPPPPPSSYSSALELKSAPMSMSSSNPASATPPLPPAPSGSAPSQRGPTIQEAAQGEFYGSAARVVLLGHGADEQCGGYGRHRTRFRNGGWTGLAEELEVDVRRLWLRNLGRDDRLVADWGREARHPFLDEDVMQLLLHARLDSIVDLRLPAGQGDKRVLRTALVLLGLPRAAARVKRAIQFGSRIGKASNTRDFGSNRQANRRNAGGVALQDVKKAAATAAMTPPKLNTAP